MRILRPEENRPLRPNVVRFECHIEYEMNKFSLIESFPLRMTKNDIKQYLEKIYKVDVLDITTIIKQGLYYIIYFIIYSRFYFLGKENRHPMSSEIIDPDPDQKMAYVFLVKKILKKFFSLKIEFFLEK
jgi:hypothetical protein